MINSIAQTCPIMQSYTLQKPILTNQELVNMQHSHLLEQINRITMAKLEF